MKTVLFMDKLFLKFVKIPVKIHCANFLTHASKKPKIINVAKFPKNLQYF